MEHIPPLGRLIRVKNKKPKGNEEKEYLATKLEFPDHGEQNVMFRPDELVRPLARALRQKDDLPTAPTIKYIKTLTETEIGFEPDAPPAGTCERVIFEKPIIVKAKKQNK